MRCHKMLNVNQSIIMYVYTTTKRSNSIPIIISLSSTTDNEPFKKNYAAVYF